MPENSGCLSFLPLSPEAINSFFLVCDVSEENKTKPTILEIGEASHEKN